MAAGKQAHQQQVDDVTLAHDHFRKFGLNLFSSTVELLHNLAIGAWPDGDCIFDRIIYGQIIHSRPPNAP